MQLSKALRLLRVMHDFSQSALASKFGVSRAYICEIEKGDKMPSLTFVQIYSERFDIPLSAIFFMAECIEKDIKPQQFELHPKVAAILELRSLTQKG